MRAGFTKTKRVGVRSGRHQGKRSNSVKPKKANKEKRRLTQSNESGKIAETNACPREMGGRLIKTGVFVNYQPLLVIAELLSRDGITMKPLTFVKNSSGEDVMEMIITLHRNQNVNQDVSRCQLTQIKKESEKLHLA